MVSVLSGGCQGGGRWWRDGRGQVAGGDPAQEDDQGGDDVPREDAGDGEDSDDDDRDPDDDGDCDHDNWRLGREDDQ